MNFYLDQTFQLEEVISFFFLVLDRFSDQFYLNIGLNTIVCHSAHLLSLRFTHRLKDDASIPAKYSVGWDNKGEGQKDVNRSNEISLACLVFNDTLSTCRLCRARHRRMKYILCRAGGKHSNINKPNKRKIHITLSSTWALWR